MAYIYMAGGAVLKVPTSREAIMNDLNSTRPARILEYEVDFPAGGAMHPTRVAVNPAQIAVVSEQQLPTS
jgi:hypothetical protein